MKRRLVLVRHAKAAQAGVDFDRPLAPRGRTEAAEIGQWLTAQNIHPDLVVVSPSRRTRETWELARAEMSGAASVDHEARVDFDARVYEDTLDDLLAVIHDIGADVQTVMVVGHNPALQELAVELDGFPATPAGFAVVEHLPTSGVVVLDIDDAIGWPDVVLGTATVSKFASPASGW